MTTLPKHARHRPAPPVPLSAPISIPLDAELLRNLNEYRRATHSAHHPPEGYFPMHTENERKSAETARESLVKGLLAWVDAEYGPSY